MDANFIICIIMIIICICISIFGWKIFDKWYKKVNDWEENGKARDEFMECLITGWAGIMIAMLGGIPAAFLVFALVSMLF